ncbi:unnamed protein product [Menidia menidia]|uniref:(Atlantic silverside) hypothetical protein n=1 Tax=Menidia menidia TaxID=238744 RepID=A0A8S4AIP0_9TELE|nr:unnamed protein product [Menidia menidia]
MDMLLQTSIFLWILAGCLSLPGRSETWPNNNLSAVCNFVSRNVCLEFVEESKTWSGAESSCEKKGGKLLKELNLIKIFLSKITRGRNSSNISFWMGERVQVEYREPNQYVSREVCAYITLNPLQFLTSNCSEKRGFLCTHSLQSPSSTEVAYTELKRMERTEEEPKDDSRNKFIQNLTEGIQKLNQDNINDNIVQSVINASTGILQLSIHKCDVDANPNPPKLFEDVLTIVQTVSRLRTPALNEKTVTRYPTGTMYQSNVEPKDLSNAVLGSESDGDYVKLPSYSALAPHLKNYKNIITQMATFSSNPHPSDDNITGTVSNIILSDGKSNIKVENLSEMIEIFLRRPNDSYVRNNTVVLEKGMRSLTAFNISDIQMTIIFDVVPDVNVSLALMLSYDSPPNSTFYDSKITLNGTDGYRWMITPEMLQQGPGVWYIDTRLENSQTETDVTLEISSYSGKCLYWDTENERWSAKGCMVGDKSTPMVTQCLCNHLTLFGSSFFVMPNHVDISRTAELFATVSENYVVLALLCAFYGLYLVTLLWAGYADRRSRFKRKMTLLEDSHPGALYNYLVCVQTGHRKNAGTSANVTVKLIGSDGESSIQNLTDPEKPVFERGATDMFLLATPFPLGEVHNIRLQHDNSGGHPSWYINKVTIQDLQTRQVWQFLCECWLSNDRGDGATKKTFNAAKSNEIASFRNIFQSRTSTGFRDEHIWVSIVDPPSRSPFTRAQRVSCCMSLLLCTMAINIAFWNIPVNKDSPVLFSLGSLEITWQEIMVGVQSGLLMFPINILIITIFRSIRPRVISKSKIDDSEEKPRPPAITVPTVLKEIEEVISLVSKSPRNKMPDVVHLESTADLCPALDTLHILIQKMQGETESNNHCVYCSKFLLAGLCHLLMCLEKLDEKNFPSSQDYQQALSLTNLLVRKAEMVFSSHLPAPVRKKKKTPVGCRLPWWCVFVGWFLLLSISGISTYFTLLYGFQYGREKSIKWVMSLGLSLFESIFILQPLKVIGVAVFFALLLKPVAVEDTEEVEQVLLEQEIKCRGYTGRVSL